MSRLNFSYPACTITDREKVTLNYKRASQSVVRDLLYCKWDKSGLLSSIVYMFVNHPAIAQKTTQLTKAKNVIKLSMHTKRGEVLNWYNSNTATSLYIFVYSHITSSRL